MRYRTLAYPIRFFVEREQFGVVSRFNFRLGYPAFPECVAERQTGLADRVLIVGFGEYFQFQKPSQSVNQRQFRTQRISCAFPSCRPPGNRDRQ